MTSTELAQRFMDNVLFDGDYINRWHPFDSNKHYGPWLSKFESLFEELAAELGWDFFDNDFIEMFPCGDYDDVMRAIELYPSLQQLYNMLNEYGEWLNENV